MLYSILVTVQVVIALSLIGLVLIQHGKGADAGAAFGSGASGTVFGAKGSANFLSRATAALAAVFFAISLTLAYLVHGASAPSGSVTDRLSQQTPPSATVPANQNGTPRKQNPAGNAPASNTGSAGVASHHNGQSSARANAGGQRKANPDNSGTGAQIPQ